MSEAPSPREPRTDPDAWSTACAEDTAEQASKRRVRQAYQPGSPADELRKLADAVAGKVQELRNPLVGLPAQALISQAKSVLGQARNRNPDLFDHLAAAGSELLAAYRSAVDNHERGWTDDGPSSTERIDLDRIDLERIDVERRDAGRPDAERVDAEPADADTDAGAGRADEAAGDGRRGGDGEAPAPEDREDRG